MLNFDPFGLDRTLARFAELRARFEAALARGAGQEHAFELRPDVLDGELLERLADAGDRDPLAAPLARWAAFLLLEHACLGSKRRVAEALHAAVHPLDQPERGTFSLVAMRRRAALDPDRAEPWISALAARSSHLQARRFEYFETRAERASALRVPLPSQPTPLTQAAARCLALTTDAYAALGIGSLGELLQIGVGRDTPGVFPTRLSTRALGELFREGPWLAGLEPRIERLPELWGASSFLRALASFGRALHDAAPSASRPFVLTHDPYGLRSALFGHLFALLPLNPTFAARRLDVGRARFADYRRALGRVLLASLRSDLVRVELEAASQLGARSYERVFCERVPEALNFELPRELAGVLWVDELAPTRFAALLAASARSDELVRNHDEDWFRNPRAIAELRAEFESPPPRELPQAQLERGLEQLVHLHTNAG